VAQTIVVCGLWTCILRRVLHPVLLYSVSPTFVPLSEATLDDALELRRQLYLHEDLAYEPGNAAALMRELIASPIFGMLWLIQIEDQTAGYLLVTLCYSLEFQGRFGLLDEFYLDEPWRGQGIGSAALEFAEHSCRALGLKALRLEVAHTNLRALDLYRRQGFSLESRHLMTKWL
jgi:ribosomal protein S18 acetylase RimI-like enzyme